MARAPRASVSKTSGQGTSRLSYQKGRSLGNQGTATPGGGGRFSAGLEAPSSGRSYAKGEQPEGLNFSYGLTLGISNIDDLKDFGVGVKPKKPLTPKQSKKLK